MKKIGLLILASSLLFGLNISSGLNNKASVHVVENNKTTIRCADPTTTLDVPSEFGSKVGDLTISGVNYINYTAGYVKNSGSSYSYYAGKNIDASGNVALTGLSTLTSYIGNDFATSEDGTSDNVRNLLPRTYSKSKIKQLFTEKYTAAYNAGVVLGAKISKVKCWNSNYIVQEFRYGDSDYSYDNSRANISLLLYQYKTDKAYIVKDGIIGELASNSSTIGQPLADADTYSVTLPDENTKKDVYLQLFESGFVYKNGTNYIGMSGYLYAEDSGTFTAIALPDVPGEYGDVKDHIIVSDSKQIVVYEYGSVICDKGNSSKYSYTLRPARIYTSETDFTMVPVDHFYDEWSDGIASFSGDDVATKFKEVFNKYYEAGFFIGFMEGSYDSSWNGVTAQQFKWGDSTANPWDDGREHIAALVYNEDADTANGEQEVVLLKDSMLEAWDNNWSNYGSPLSDAQTDSSDGKTLYQQFKGGLLVMAYGDSSLSFFFSDGTVADYQAGKAEYTRPTLGASTTVTTVDMTPEITIAIVIPSVVVVAGIVVVLLMIKKKHKSVESKK